MAILVCCCRPVDIVELKSIAVDDDTCDDSDMDLTRKRFECDHDDRILIVLIKNDKEFIHMGFVFQIKKS